MARTKKSVKTTKKKSTTKKNISRRTAVKKVPKKKTVSKSSNNVKKVSKKPNQDSFLIVKDNKKEIRSLHSQLNSIKKITDKNKSILVGVRGLKQFLHDVKILKKDNSSSKKEIKTINIKISDLHSFEKRLIFLEKEYKKDKSIISELDSDLFDIKNEINHIKKIVAKLDTEAIAREQQKQKEELLNKIKIWKDQGLDVSSLEAEVNLL